MYGDGRPDERERISSVGKKIHLGMRTSTRSQGIHDGVGCVRSSTGQHEDGVLFAHVEGIIRLVTPSWIRKEFACGLVWPKSSARSWRLRDMSGDSRGLGEPGRQSCTFADVLRASRFSRDTSTTLQSVEAVTEPYVSSVADNSMARFSCYACYGGCGDCDNLATFRFDR